LNRALPRWALFCACGGIGFEVPRVEGYSPEGRPENGKARLDFSKAGRIVGG
jgi:hypothetical protein